MIAMTTTTMMIPTHTPAWKISAMSWQPGVAMATKTRSRATGQYLSMRMVIVELD